MQLNEQSKAIGHRTPLFPASDDRVIRALDIVLSLTMLIFFLPLMALIAAAIFVTDPGPIIFRQNRLGRGGQYFKCFKFRSMVVDAEAQLQHLLSTDPEARLSWEVDHKLKVDPRITPIGNFLRRSSFDELPQLFNVLRGDMSLVGPRPICEAETRRYGRFIRDYCSVRPGITGLWQVSGRNDTSYDRRVMLDVFYARKQSVDLYLKIAVMTVPAVLMARGSY
jgi:lipopolysaccharide/colanic/teichoic acid biosynthesis glycosyltransferase